MESHTWKEMGLTDEEYEQIVKDMGRSPNLVELGMYAVMWSEHCSYKHSRNTLKKLPGTGSRVLQGPGENAGVIDLGEGLAICFKIESHNHPSAIEPYQGAATGVGGIIRDIFSMGARPLALLNSLRFGNLDDPLVSHLFDGVVSGISGYGNCVGIPTVAGEIYFQSCYQENPLVNAMCVGVMPHENLIRGHSGQSGNYVVLMGSPTGKDGIHGVTFASEELSDASQEKRSSVQVGDPFMEKLLLESCLELVENHLIAGMQDLGGAGLTCATTEVASRGDTGMEIELEKVPCREPDMTPYHTMLSESQERMLLIIEKEKLDQALKIVEKWGVPFSIIGKITSDNQVTVKHRGETVAQVVAKSVADGAPICSPESIQPSYLSKNKSWSPDDLSVPSNLQDVFLKLVGAPSVASKESVWRRYDHMVRTSTVVRPGMADAAVLKLRDSNKGIAVTVDGNSRHVYLDPYLGGMKVVAEATRNLSCTGALPLGITDCLNFGSPENPEIFWQFERSVEGIAEACKQLGLPVVGGNVSFYNESRGAAIFPTPVVGAVGLFEDVRKHATASFKNEGDLIFLLGAGEVFSDNKVALDNKVSLGGSQYLQTVHGMVAGVPALLALDQEMKVQSLVREAIDRKLLASAHDLSEGGIALALAESSILGETGVLVDLNQEKLRPDTLLFGEGPSLVIVSLSEENMASLETLAHSLEVSFCYLGKVVREKFQININGKEVIGLTPAHLQEVWDTSVEKAMT